MSETNNYRKALSEGDEVEVHFPNNMVKGEVLYIPTIVDCKLILKESDSHRLVYVNNYNFIRIIS